MPARTVSPLPRPTISPRSTPRSSRRSDGSCRPWRRCGSRAAISSPPPIISRAGRCPMRKRATAPFSCRPKKPTARSSSSAALERASGGADVAVCRGRVVLAEQYPCLGEERVGLRAHAEVAGLLEPEHAAVLVEEDRRGNGKVAEGAALRREVALLHIVEAVHGELGIGQERDRPCVLALEGVELVAAIGAHRHELDAERGEVAGVAVELPQLADAIRTPDAAVEF